MAFLTTLVAIALSQADVQASGTTAPGYAPRAFYLGAFDEGPEVSLQIRLQWQVPLVRKRPESVALIIEAGGGYGIFGPLTPPTVFYENVVLVGAAYRALYDNGFNWGLQIATGPLLYGVSLPNQGLALKVDGLIEGRAHGGITLGGATYGLVVGYALPYNSAGVNVLGGQLRGGLTFGIYVDWRPPD